MKARLLLVEDSEGQGYSLCASLEQLGYSVTWVRSGVEAMKLARTDPPELVLLDIGLDDVDGFSVCRWLRFNDATRFVPVLMLTARDQLRDKVLGFNVGANDYLAKPVQPEELEARIYAALRAQARHLELQQRNSELEAMLQDVERLAITDPLTGVFNRRRFSDVLEREFAVSRRYNHSLCCVLSDIDHFKRVNDVHGHAMGDQVLKQVAGALAGTLREVDLVARYGGEEFAILLPQTGKSNALVAVGRLAETVRRLKIEVKGQTLGLTASFGVACTNDIQSSDPSELVRAADMALYLAKKHGRDRIEVYEASDSVIG